MAKSGCATTNGTVQCSVVVFAPGNNRPIRRLGGPSALNVFGGGSRSYVAVDRAGNAYVVTPMPTRAWPWCASSAIREGNRQHRRSRPQRARRRATRRARGQLLVWLANGLTDQRLGHQRRHELVRTRLLTRSSPRSSRRAVTGWGCSTPTFTRAGLLSMTLRRATTAQILRSSRLRLPDRARDAQGAGACDREVS